VTKRKSPFVFNASEDFMNEVLADHIGYFVTVTLKDGRKLTGHLRPEVLDDYQILDRRTGAPLGVFDRADVVELEDLCEAFV